MIDILLILTGCFIGVFCSCFVLNDLIIYNVEKELRDKGLKVKLKRSRKGDSHNA